jgi:transposase-like protein
MAKQAKKEESARRRMVIESIVEGRKMEAYAEHRTKEMHTCWVCGAICYRKTPGRNVGQRWICIDCLRQLKETLDNLDQWEEELAMQKEARSQLDSDLGA